jgi:hypothetical protein
MSIEPPGGLVHYKNKMPFAPNGPSLGGAKGVLFYCRQSKELGRDDFLLIDRLMELFREHPEFEPIPLNDLC